MEDKQYTYEPLDNSADEIWLISIQPHSDLSRPIQLNIIHTKLSEKPRYEALSYMWGSEESPQHVEVQGKRLEVTQNLWLALQRLRTRDEARVLWVDAICIHQRNTKERNHQVSQMSKIYRQAWRVAVWLGSETEDSGMDIEFFKVLAAISENLKLKRHYTDYQLELASGLCDVPYWGRLWIIQEVVLAEDIILYCGEDELEWNTFAAVIKRQITFNSLSIKKSTPTNLVQQRMAHKITEQKGFLNFASSTIPDLVHRFSGAACRDTRDHIFGLMALANGCC